MDLDGIPGYREALDKERALRDAACLELTTSICGVEIRGMTLRDLLVLISIKSPFVSGGAPSKEDVAAFLWILSPQFEALRRLRENWFLSVPLGWLSRIARRRFVRRLRRVEFADALAQINEYIEQTFMDSPASSGARGEPITSFAVSLTDFVSEHRYWSRESILSMPLVVLYQHVRLIQLSINPKTPIFNALSGRVRGDYLRSSNQPK